jgi:asparagine synthase (glutamine-hydrolysing)
MCGIAGIVCSSVERPIAAEALRAMTRAIAHRGPDDDGFFCEAPVGLGHRRLSVIDIAGGHQPMTDASATRVAIYNGEIYNYRELKSRLEQSGARFRTNSDTEVLVETAQFEETAWVHAINGMYAFAMWDRSRKALLLGRDRLGVKPLYYAFHDGCFLFASEIKAILAYPGFPRAVNEAAIPEYLRFRSLAGAETFFKGVFMFPAGHVGWIGPSDFRLNLKRFWHEDATAFLETNGEAAKPVDAQFADLFASAVAYRLVSDVPIGTFNSGGVDSSLVTQSVRAQTSGELHTFSVGFDEASFDERRYAETVASTLGTQHHTLVMNRHEYADGLEETIWHMDEPLPHAHSVQLVKLSRLAKEFVTVVLTGEGADETFAGYPRHQIPLIARSLGRAGAALKLGLRPLAQTFGLRRVAKLAEFLDSWEASVVNGARFSADRDLATLHVAPHCPQNRLAILTEVFARRQSFLESVLEYDRRTYLPPLLVRLDKTSMAAGLEARVPFLDFRMVLWTKALAPEQKVALWRESKIMLKRLAARSFPNEMIYRRKVGFGVPVGLWLRDKKSLGRFGDLLTDATFRQRGYCDGNSVRQMCADHFAGRADHGEVLWPILNLELWWRRFIANPPS